MALVCRQPLEKPSHNAAIRVALFIFDETHQPLNGDDPTHSAIGMSSGKHHRERGLGLFRDVFSDNCPPPGQLIFPPDPLFPDQIVVKNLFFAQDSVGEIFVPGSGSTILPKLNPILLPAVFTHLTRDAPFGPSPKWN
jgi:hypothetical protein